MRVEGVVARIDAHPFDHDYCFDLPTERRTDWEVRPVQKIAILP